MTRILPAALLLLGVATPALGSADAAPPFGRFHVGLEVDRMSMQHETFDTDDTGAFFGLSGYGHVSRGWYVGGEVGGGGSLSLFGGDESSQLPIEVNVTRAFTPLRRVAFDVGGGLSVSRVDFSTGGFLSEKQEADDWVFGGQVLGNVRLRAGWGFLGLKLKYQLTADSDEIADLAGADEGWDYSNLKIGLTVGIVVN